MFKVTQKGLNRLHIELSGKLNSEEMQIALDELVSKSKEIEKGRMLYDVIGKVQRGSGHAKELISKRMILKSGLKLAL